MLLGGPTFSARMDAVVMTVPGGKACKPFFLTADRVLSKSFTQLTCFNGVVVKNAVLSPERQHFAGFHSVNVSLPEPLYPYSPFLLEKLLFSLGFFFPICSKAEIRRWFYPCKYALFFHFTLPFHCRF